MKGRVYKIIHNQSDICYVGSTINDIRFRWYHHKIDYKRPNGNRICSLYKYFDKYGIENFKPILIKEYDVVDKKHLKTKEQLWISKLNCVNKYCCVPFLWADKKTTLYYNLKKEKIKRVAKEYYHKHKERIKKKQREQYHKNKEKYLKRTKAYYQKNKDKYKKRYVDNKEKSNDK